MKSCWPPRRPLVPCVGFLLAVLWIADPFPENPPASVSSLVGEKQTVTGTLLEGPLPGRSGTKGLVQLSSPWPPSSEGRPSKIKALLTFEERFPQRGDLIRFTTRFKRPPQTQNPGAFNTRRHLARQHIFLTGFVPAGDWELVSRSQPVSPLDSLKRFFSKQLQKTSSDETTQGFLQALILGDRSQLSQELWTDFQKTGTAHLLAISGQHVGLVFSFCLLLLLWMLKQSEALLLTFSVRKIASLLALLPALFYVGIAGAPPSAVRSILMLATGVAAFWFRRDLEIFSTLALAALLVTLLDPAAPFGASFQLSFLAVLSLALFVTPLSQRSFLAKTSRAKKWLLLSLVATTAATLGTAPLAASRFHLVSISGLLTNLWAIPFVGLILVGGGIALFLSVIPLIGPLTLSLVGKGTELFLWLTHHSAQWSFTLETYPTGWEVAVAYFLLLFLALRIHQKIGWRTTGLIAVPLLAVLLFWNSFPSRNLRVTFLDVGQGDAALLRTPHGKSILIDGGGFLIPGKPHPFDVGKEVVLPYLKRAGVEKIDLMILSHPHPDHYGGLQAVVEKFPIGEFWWNGQSFPDESFEKLLSTIRQKGQLRKVTAPYRQTMDGLSLEVIYPGEVWPSRGINDNCLVVQLDYGAMKFLFPGDIEREAEKELVQSPKKLAATVLKIPHHGSRTSSSVPFIDAIVPRYAVASLADGNMFGFPHEGVLEKYERRGIKVFRTDRHGAVTFTTDGQSLSVKPFANP